MGGSGVDDDWEIASSVFGIRTVVLIGRTGNGKSATGNSILGEKVFKSTTSMEGVTKTCELRTTALEDGQILKVIDTPGLFEASAQPEFVGKEIVKCITMAKDGIHAVLLVLSVKNRFTEEEEAAVHSLRTLFGRKINNYMIVVFTGGDELEEEELTLEDYLSLGIPDSLREILHACGNRRVLFNNRTKDGSKKAEQVRKLLSLVNLVIEKNDGKPYSDDIFIELKRGVVKHHDLVNSLEGCPERDMPKLKEQLDKAYEDQINRITEMVESKLKDAVCWLEQQLAEEQAARLKAEERAQEARMKSDVEISKLRENLDRAQRETEELRRQAEKAKCTIL